MFNNVVEVIRRSDQGQTRPFICRADDGAIYFVKGRNTTRAGQINEWICANLAHLLGLPIAPFQILNVDTDIIEETPEYNDLGIGPAFASKRQTASELQYSQVKLVPSALQRDLVLFDWWIKNSDRSLSPLGGNPNLFWHPARSQLVIFDHNLALDSATTLASFDTHVFRPQLNNELKDDPKLRGSYSSRFETALSQWQSIIGQIPSMWLYQDLDMTVPIDYDFKASLALLQMYLKEDFWTWD